MTSWPMAISPMPIVMIGRAPNRSSITPTSLAPGGVVMNPCAYAGYQLDFKQDKLVQLYRTHAGYVQQVVKDTKKLVRERFLLPEDARGLVAAARQSDVLTGTS